MKNFTTNVLPFILIAAVGLAGCAAKTTVPVISAPTQTAVKVVANETIKLLPTNVQNNIQKVQNATKTVCKFVPTASTIASLVNNSQTVMTVSDVAQAICGVVGNKHKRFGAAPGTKIIAELNGTIITGTFVE